MEASGALASTRLCLLAEVEDDRFALVGWASDTVLGQLGCQVSVRLVLSLFYYCFSIFDICFNLVFEPN